MIRILLLALVLVGCKNGSQHEIVPSTQAPAYALVIHGGAGYQHTDNHDAVLQARVSTALNKALDIGESILKKGGSSLDAVEQVIRQMEDDSLFNAGRGAVFTHNGTNEHDASIMYGADLDAGAVGGTNTVKHPISAARAVMEQSKHVMMSGRGAEQFAKEVGLEIVDPAYFYTQARYESLQRALQSEVEKEGKHGTVGCVALDRAGHITAGTSTGGMTNKQYNRIGDSPIIGAGTYASDRSCGVSSTGHGEYFMRYTVARDIAARMELAGESLQEASDHMIHKVLDQAGGKGGIIALDYLGNISMTFNTPGMYRGYVKPGERLVGMFQDENR